MPRAVYPGTFDPVTNGHLDLIERGRKLFSDLIVLVADNPRKTPLFTAAERVEMLRVETAGMDNVTVDSSAGLTVDYVRRMGYDAILRGIRTTTDFVAEHQMALTNRSLAPEVEAVFVMPSAEWSYLSSSLIREVVLSGGDVSRFVPPSVLAALTRKLG